MTLREIELNLNKDDAFAIAAIPEVAAEVAGLRYVSDETPGLVRRRRGKGFTYVDSSGKPISDKKTIERIETLRIPPAWTDVWICPKANGHLQVTGRDAKNRKQYLYHEDWGRARNQTKFERMRVFGKKLPTIRRRVAADLKKSGLPRERVIAAIVSVMDKTLIRIGNEEYARTNDSYGLTTLRNRHVKVKGSHIEFHFRGKSGKDHQIELEDPRVAKVLRKCQELPGQELFSFRDESGELTTIDSGHVNDYLREISGEDFTAKDFRTWGGSVWAMRSLLASGPCEKERERKRRITQAIRHAAEHLGNTLTICRKYYVHPCLFDQFENGILFEVCAKLKGGRKNGLKTDEVLFLSLLESQKKPANKRVAAVARKVIDKLQSAS